MKRVLVLSSLLLLLVNLGVFGDNQRKDEDLRKVGMRTEEKLPPMTPSHEEINVIRKYLTPEPRISYPFMNDTVGFTYYDYQHNDVQRRQIAVDDFGSLHFTWTDLIGPGWDYNRYMDYNSYFDGYWLNPGGIHITPAPGGAGYGGLDLLPDSREVVYYSRFNDWYTTISIEKVTPGLGAFNAYDIPDWTWSAVASGVWPSLACSKHYNGDTAYIHITHTEWLSAGGSWRHLGYIRCFQDSVGSDTLLCQSPGSAPVKIPPNQQFYTGWKNYNFATVLFGGTVVATSPVSNKVAIVWIQNKTSNWLENEIMYLESTNNGSDWMSSGSMGTPTQITSYGWMGYYYKAMYDVAAVYDYNDNLHIMWTTYKWDYYNDVDLWHWDQSTDTIRQAGSAYSYWTVYTGAWNLLIAKMTMGVGSMPGDTSYNYLYCLYTKFRYDDRSNYGWANGDLYVVASSSSGRTWGPEINITNTNTNGCISGYCLSEHWASLAERVDSFLYIQYIDDQDAGGVPQGEGDFTNNPVRYLKYPRSLVSGVPRLSYRLRNPWRIRWVRNGSSISEDGYFDNIGTAILYVKLKGPSWLSISPNNFSIPEDGPTQTVDLTFNGDGFADTLLIDSLMIVSNDGVLFGQGIIYADTKWVKFHFLVTDSFYTYNWDRVSGGAVKTAVDNLGTLGGYLGMCEYKEHSYLPYCTPVIITDILGPDDPLIAYSTPSAPSTIERQLYLPQSAIERTDCYGLHTTKIVSRFAPFNRELNPPYHCWWWWWGVEAEDWFFWNSGKYDQVIVRKIKLSKYPPPPWWSDVDPEPPSLIPIYFGLAVNWDVPTECQYRNIGGYDDSRNLIWITSDSSGFQNYYGGVLFLGADVIDPITGHTHYSAPFGAHVMDWWTLMAFKSGTYDVDSLYKYMSMSGWSVESDLSQNKQIIITATPYLNNLSPFSTVKMKCALIITDQGKGDLYSLAADVDSVKCGDANSDGKVTVSDVIYLINYLFKGGPAPWFFYSDTNGDGKITVSDVVYLIIYLFKGGSSPLCNYMGEL